MLGILDCMEATWHTLCMGIPFIAMRDMATTPVATVVATPMANLVAIAMAIAMAMVTSLMAAMTAMAAMAMATSPAVMEVSCSRERVEHTVDGAGDPTPVDMVEISGYPMILQGFRKTINSHG